MSRTCQNGIKGAKAPIRWVYASWRRWFYRYWSRVAVNLDCFLPYTVGETIAPFDKDRIYPLQGLVTEFAFFIISRFKIVQARFDIVEIPTITEGIYVAYMIWGRYYVITCVKYLMISPSIVSVFYYKISVAVKYGDNIPLHILAVHIDSPITIQTN